jgi:hypothetical protein
MGNDTYNEYLVKNKHFVKLTSDPAQIEMLNFSFGPDPSFIYQRFGVLPKFDRFK